MKTPLQSFAIYVRDLLKQPEGAVLHLGRKNFRHEDFKSLQIIVDDLGPESVIANSESFNPESEEMTYSQQWQKPITVDFYGVGAYQEAIKFIGLMPSRPSYDLQEKLSLCVKITSQITDVKRLTGEQYSERYQIELNLIHTTSTTIPQLRIDAAPTELKT